MSKIVLAIVATIAGLGMVVGLIVGTVYLTGGGHHTTQSAPRVNIKQQQQQQHAVNATTTTANGRAGAATTSSTAGRLTRPVECRSGIHLRHQQR